MKPLTQRIATYTATTPVETSMPQVFERVLWALDQERIMLEETVWAPRISARRWRRLNTRHLELMEIISIVKALRDRHLGNPSAPGPRTPRLNPPTGAYGER